MPDWSEIIRHPDVQTLIALALREDLGSGDATTAAIFQTPQRVRARLVARSETTLCGVTLAQEIIRRLEPDADFPKVAPEGARLSAGDVALEIDADVRGLLSAERCALNFAMRLSGIAHAARQAVAALPAGSKTQILDTRKTTPGWRVLEKAAVVTGGGTNQRQGLYDAILIKDNHIAAAGSVRAAIEAAKRYAADHAALHVQVEVDTLIQLDEALAAKPDSILLDNFSLDELRTAVKRTAGAVPLEASGGMTHERIAAVAATGVDRISMGALTHSAMPADLALDF